MAGLSGYLACANDGPAALPGDDLDRALVADLQNGLDLVPRPYAAVAARLGLDEREVLARVRRLVDAGVIKRLGVVVRHHELGFLANAMVVWDVPDREVEEAGRRLAGSGRVSLCYRRPRRPPHWPYNLFCMLHGRDRRSVLERLDVLRAEFGMDAYAHRVLFSTRRFKQRGARYVEAPRPVPEVVAGG